MVERQLPKLYVVGSIPIARSNLRGFGWQAADHEGVALRCDCANLAYYGVAAQTKLEYGAAYIALTAFLAVMVYELHEMIGTAGRHA